MTDYDDDLDLDAEGDEVEETPAPKKPNWRRQLEAEAKRAKELEAQLAAIQRQTAIDKAGLDTSDPRIKFFVDNYSGDPANIRQAAETAGFLTPAQPEVPQAEFDALSRMQTASGGATNVTELDTAMSELDGAQSEHDVLALLRKYVPDAVITNSSPGRWMHAENSGAQPRS